MAGRHNYNNKETVSRNEDGTHKRGTLPPKIIFDDFVQVSKNVVPVVQPTPDKEKIVSKRKKGNIISNTATRPAEGGVPSFRPPPAPPQDELPPIPSALPDTEIRLPKVKMRISGAFGTMSAAFDSVIVNDKLIVLVIDTESDNYYLPPISDAEPLAITLRGETYNVINPGIAFEDDQLLYTILVKIELLP